MRVCVFCVDEIYFSPRSRLDVLSPGRCCLPPSVCLRVCVCVCKGKVCVMWWGGVEVGEVLIAAPQ